MNTRVMENGAPAEADTPPDFLFTSGQGSLGAYDLGQPIVTPAGDWPLLAQQITRALDAARAAGQANPLLIGAFAFDPAEASCLYVPSRYKRGEKLAPTEPSSVTAVEQAPEANRVISVQSTPPASEFQASVSAALDGDTGVGGGVWAAAGCATGCDEA